MTNQATQRKSFIIEFLYIEDCMPGDWAVDAIHEQSARNQFWIEHGKDYPVRITLVKEEL